MKILLLLLVVLGHCEYLETPELTGVLKNLRKLNQSEQQRLNSIRTDLGFTLKDAIHTAIRFPYEHNKNIFLPDYSGYHLFRQVIEPTLMSYYPRDCDPYTISPVPNYRFDPDPQQYIYVDPADQKLLNERSISARMRVVRNLKGYPFTPKLNSQQRKELQKMYVEKLEQLQGEYQGTYYPAAQMSKQQLDELYNQHLMFKKAPKGARHDVAGFFDEWPVGSGLFMSRGERFSAWIGQEDQLRLIYMEKGGDLKGIYRKLHYPVNKFDNHFDFVFDQQLGYMSTSTGNIGTVTTASVLVRLQNLTQDEVIKFAHRNELNARGTHGVGTPVKDNVYAIQNRVRFCYTVKQLIENVYKNVAKLIRYNDEKTTIQ